MNTTDPVGHRARPAAGASGRAAWRRVAVGLAAVLVVTGLAPTTSGAQATPGGPVILMGLDSENDPGDGTHGPLADHAAMVSSLLDNVTNGGTGILVIGPESGKVQTYWENIGAHADVDEEITWVNGVEGIKARSFDGFAMIGVASSTTQISGGAGLTDAENEALITRDLDIADFVNGGGGLLGKTQDRMTNPFGYVGPLGHFEPRINLSYEHVEVTQAGLDLGLTQAGMSGWCCWHDTFAEFPSFLDAIAIHDHSGRSGFGEAAAVGGLRVAIPTGIDLEPGTATLSVGQTHELTATVEEDDAPGVDVEVTFSVTGGPHEGTVGTGTTDGTGTATFAYAGVETGTDTIVASFVDRHQRTRTSEVVTVTWLDPSTPTVPATAPGPVAEPAPTAGQSPGVEVAPSGQTAPAPDASPAQPVTSEPTFTG